MFGLFKSSPFRDPQIGELVRSRGHWRGSLAITPDARIPLALTGSRTEPEAQALAAAREVAVQFPAWRPIIGKALFEHYEPYAQAFVADELPPSLRSIAAPSQVWPHVSLEFISVTPLGGVLTTELGYTVSWDEEHTLGARFQSGNFIELCGSVLSP